MSTIVTRPMRVGQPLGSHPTSLSSTDHPRPEPPAATVALSSAATKAARAEKVSKWGVISSLAATAGGIGMLAVGACMMSPLAPLVFAVGGTIAVLGTAGALTFAGYGGGASTSDVTTTALLTMSMANNINTLSNLR